MKGRADSPSRLHDARSEQWAVLEGPLLPSVLARQGRRAEAVALAEVVASQWPVGASASDLMGVFYRQLASGKTPSAALRAAQLALRAKPETAHPIHWAGFVVFEGGRLASADHIE